MKNTSERPVGISRRSSKQNDLMAVDGVFEKDWSQYKGFDSVLFHLVLCRKRASGNFFVVSFF